MRQVCVMTSVHPTFDVRIFQKECRSLVGAGYEVILIAPHDRDEVVDGVRIKAIPKPAGRMTRMTRTVWQVYREAVRLGADVYHFHDPELIPVGFILKALGKRVIYDVHENVLQDVMSKAYIPTLLRFLISRSARILETIGAWLFDYMVVAGDDIAREFGERNSIIAVRNFPKLNWFDSCNASDSAHKRQNSVVYAGGISEDRCIREYVKAMEYVKSEAELWVMGRFATPSLEKEVKEKSNNRVKFFDQVSYSKVPEYLASASIGLICFYPDPNSIESAMGRNNKVFEYMALGLPIICSDFPMWKKLVEGNQIGVAVDPRDPKKIAEAIDYILRNPAVRKKMGDNGVRLFREQFNWEAEEAKLLAVYRRLFNEVGEPLNK